MMVAVAVYSLLVLAYSIFIAVAIWRAATRYEGPTWWAVLAKLGVIGSVVYWIVDIAKVWK